MIQMNPKKLTHLYIFAILSIIMLISAQSNMVHLIRGQLQEIFFPAQKSLNNFTTSTLSFTSTLTEIQNLAKEKSQLEIENEKLKAQVTQLQELKFRIDTLQKEFGIQGLNHDQKYIASAVVSRSPSSFKSIMTIDKGKQDGININQPVISNGFLIGRIIDVFPGSSQVELISSHGFETPVILQNSRLLGLLRGGLKGLEVEQLPVDGKIQVGETIVTSGLAGELPSGLPVGQVKQITSQPSDIFQSVLVNTPVNTSQIELVLILVGG